MKQWFEHREKGAGKFRLECLFFIYKILGYSFFKFFLRIVVFFIWLFSPTGRTASKKYGEILNLYQKNHHLPITKINTYKHFYRFAIISFDKVRAFMGEKLPITFKENSDFEKNILNQKGCFWITSHLGNVEVSPTLLTQNKLNLSVLAFMQITQNSIFHQFLTKHAIYPNIKICSTEQMSVESGIEIMDTIKKGNLVIMAGDRVSAQNTTKIQQVQILDHPVYLPTGVFKIAKKSEGQIYFATCLYTDGTYKLILKKNKTTDIVSDFADFLTEQILQSPYDWFNFYDFWNINN